MPLCLMISDLVCYRFGVVFNNPTKEDFRVLEGAWIPSQLMQRNFDLKKQQLAGTSVYPTYNSLQTGSAYIYNLWADQALYSPGNNAYSLYQASPSRAVTRANAIAWGLTTPNYIGSRLLPRQMVEELIYQRIIEETRSGWKIINSRYHWIVRLHCNNKHSSHLL